MKAVATKSRRTTTSTVTTAPVPVVAAIPPAPMLHERWVVFLLVRGDSDSQVRELLLRDDLPVPDDAVLDAMRAGLVLPQRFKPKAPKHAKSRAFIQKLGLEALFDETPAVAQALALLRSPRPREVAEAALLGAVPHAALAQILAQLFKVTVTPDAVTMFVETFFAISSVSRAQLRLLLEERLRAAILAVAPKTDGHDLRRLVASDPRVMALSLPSSPLAWANVLMKLGWTPPRQELDKIINSLESLSAVRLGGALLRGGHNDDKRAESCVSVLRQVREIKEAVASPAEILNRQLGTFRLTHDSKPIATVRSLRDRGDDVTVDIAPPMTAESEQDDVADDEDGDELPT